jgi:hypothetical protein
MKLKVMTPSSSNPKTAKDQTHYTGGILHLAPSTLSGTNLCPSATPGCILSCLNTAGRGAFTSIQKARIKRTVRYLNQRDAFLDDLISDLGTIRRKAMKLGLKPVARLNGTSDVDWEKVTIVVQTNHDIQFYDYTKSAARYLAFLAGKFPKNYHLTFSRSELNEAAAKRILKKGGNVAVVFDHQKPLPSYWSGFTVIDGDKSDLRFLDPKNVVIGLKAKGKAKKDTTGFVVRH